MRDNGLKLSKLNKILLCSNFLEIQPQTSVTALPREYSDHSPIILACNLGDFGPLPFIFFNSWIFTDGFESIIKNAWSNFSRFGLPNMYLATKLKHLKNSLESRRNSCVTMEILELNSLKNEINRLDLEAEFHTLLEHEGMILKNNKHKMLEIKKMDLRKKSWVKWIVDGDENT